MTPLTQHPTICGCIIRNNRFELHQEWCRPCLEASLPRPKEGVVAAQYTNTQVELRKAAPVDDWMEGL